MSSYQNRGVTILKNYTKQLSVVMLSLSIFSFNLGASYANGITFKDVTTDFWANENIQWAIDNKVVDGYPDGTFKPNLAVNQSEFLTMLIRAFQPSDITPSSDPTNWATPYLKFADKLGWKAKVPSDHTSLSRGAVAQYLANATGKNYSIDDSIQYLLDLGLSEGRIEKSLEGYHKTDEVTRSEAVTFIQRFRQNYTQLNSIPASEQKYNRSEVLTSYHDTKYNFTLYLPKIWEGTYAVVYTLHPNDIETFDFINKANKDFGGVLFTISAWPKNKWNAEGEEIAKNIRISKIGEKGDKAFTLSFPTDVQYSLDNQKQKAEYLSMYDDIITQKVTFEVN